MSLAALTLELGCLTPELLPLPVEPGPLTPELAAQGGTVASITGLTQPGTADAPSGAPFLLDGYLTEALRPQSIFIQINNLPLAAYLTVPAAATWGQR